VAEDKGIQFEATVAAGADCLIETDKLRLEQILRNLLSNALKFTKKGTVLLAVSRQNGTLSFAVKDTGIGIPKNKQQSIFEAFQQADGSTRRKYGGTGLGLSISRELAKLLGGEIHLQSDEGVGSTFTLNIPVSKGELLVMPQSKPVPAIEQSVTPTLPPAPEWDKKFTTAVIPLSLPDDRDNIAKGDKVLLIIEDDTAFARSLQDFGRQKGYKVIVAVRGDEGIELAKQFLPLGILLDLQLPVKNGWEVMEALKQNPATKPIPVHMMSSHQERTKSISKGAIDFINKPMAFEKMGEIIQKIEQALSRHPKKVLIIEENPKHAKALAYFLESFNVAAEIKNDVDAGIEALSQQSVDCVILDMGVPAQQAYNTLEEVKKRPGFEKLPIIIFIGKNLSHVEEMRIKQYADSIVIKTAHSYQRILDEVSLFLHLVEENKEDKQPRYKKLGAMGEVLKGKTVLIADDDVRNIFSLTKALEGYGMNVLSAIDGKEALRQLAETPKVDIVLMDMMMPEMDGYESTQKIREQHRFKNLPVIAVTAKAMTGDREKCISAGASDYITKPVDIDQLVSLLRVWLYDKI
jgi:CheY-like chemotaxis protein/anti-sigma regulatory factor (Ser/Thr protein kinase)